MDEFRVVRDQDWMTVLFVMILLFWIAFRKLFYKNYTALRSLKAYLGVEENFVLFTTFFSLIATLVYSFLIYLFCLKNDWPARYGFTSYRAFLFFFICLSFFSLLRLLLNQLIFYLFDKEKYLKVFYRIKTFYEWRLLKILLLLEVFMVYAYFYDNRVFYLVAIVFAISIFFKYWALFRGLVRVIDIPVYHIVLYICSLEVLPILILFKYMVGVKQ